VAGEAQHAEAGDEARAVEGNDGPARPVAVADSRIAWFSEKPMPLCRMMGRKYDSEVDTRFSRKNMQAKA
jgi:hypothetical protein